jgi:transcriptional regulator with GAF, ATPase, and Fis domain
MFFLDRCARQTSSSTTGIAPDALRLLCEYDWPGNVRELQNIVERAVILSQDSVLRLDPQMLLTPGQAEISVAQSTIAVGPTAAPVPAPLGSLEDMERHHIVAALERCGGIIEGPRGAAHLLQQNPSTLRSRMKKLGISRYH